MTFPYQEINPSISRPIIPLILKSATMFIIYEGLVDSGADYCIFSLEIGRKLGVSLSDKNKVHFVGVGRDEVEGWWSEMEIRIGKHAYTTQVIFADISDFGHGILGQKGFFDHFDVQLSYERQAVNIVPISIGKN